MSQVENLIKQILEVGGNDAKMWRKLLQELLMGSEQSVFVNAIKLSVLSNPNNELALDILDYIVDNNITSVIVLLSKKEFLDDFLRLLRTDIGAPIDVQKKVLYLLQKWAVRYKASESGISLFPSFNEQYEFLKTQGIFFPPVGDDSVVPTYHRFFIKEEQPVNDLFPKSIIVSEPFPKNPSNDMFPKSTIANDTFPMNPNPSDAFPKSTIVTDTFPMNPSSNDTFPMNPSSNDTFPKSTIPTDFNSIPNNFSYPSFGDSKPDNYNPYEIGNNQVQDINSFDINQVDNQFGNNYNNQPVNNNNIVNSNFQQNNEPDLYLTQGEYEKVKNIANAWMNRINHINFMIDQGPYSYYDEQLKTQIEQLRHNRPVTEEYIQHYIRYKEALEIFICIKKDVDLTLNRFSQLQNGQPVDKFKSSFETCQNSRVCYDFNQGRAPEQNRLINTEKIKDNLTEVGHKVGSGLSTAGEKIGEGFSYVGHGLKKGGSKIKKTFVGAYEKLKDKWHGDDNNNNSSVGNNAYSYNKYNNDSKSNNNNQSTGSTYNISYSNGNNNNYNIQIQDKDDSFLGYMKNGFKNLGKSISNLAK